MIIVNMHGIADRAWGLGHGAWGREHGAWGRGHGAGSMGQGHRLEHGAWSMSKKLCFSLSFMNGLKSATLSVYLPFIIKTSVPRTWRSD